MKTLEMAISAFVSLFEDIQVFQPMFFIDIIFVALLCVYVWERASLYCFTIRDCFLLSLQCV